MAWLAVNKDGRELISEYEPERKNMRHPFIKGWMTSDDPTNWYHEDSFIWLRSGTIQKLTGKNLTWDDEPVEI